MSTHVVVPVRDELAFTKDLVAQLSEEDGWERAWIFDNGSEDGTWEYLTRLSYRDRRFRPFYRPEASIYRMWEWGVDFARMSGADYVAVLNNDIVMAPNTLLILANALAADEAHWLAYPNYDRDVADGYDPGGGLRITAGTYRHGGMCGWAFMARTAKLKWRPLIDNRLRWWAGDDDLAFEVEARGGLQVRVEGLPLYHHGSGTARHHNLDAAMAADMEILATKWGH